MRQTVAEALRQRLRRHDLCARLGGDEFAVLRPETDPARARNVFGAQFGHPGRRASDHRWPVGFSIGVAVFEPPAVGVEEAMQRADALMCAVKRSGQNGLRIERVEVSHGGAEASARSGD